MVIHEVQHSDSTAAHYVNKARPDFVGYLTLVVQAELARLGWLLFICNEVTARCREIGHLDNDQ